jgi:hypothetical protein
MIFLSYVGFRVLRRGWRGLWFPGIVYVALTIAIAVVYIAIHEDALEPWQHYHSDQWYLILYMNLCFAGFLVPWWLGIVGCFRLVRFLFRRVFPLRTLPPAVTPV